MERKSGAINVFFILFIMAFITITAVTVEFYHIFTVKEYIDTIKSINHLGNNNITSGQYLIVMYVSDEYK